MLGKDLPNNHSSEEWKTHLNLIARLYVVEHLSTEAIAAHLADNLDFKTSHFTVKKWLSKWGISRLNQQSELKLLASKYLHHQQLGQLVTFRRFGEDFPLDKVNQYIQRHPDTKACAAPLPKYLQAVVQGLQNEDENVRCALPNGGTNDIRVSKKRKRGNEPLGGRCNQNSQRQEDIRNIQDAATVINVPDDDDNDDSDDVDEALVINDNTRANLYWSIASNTQESGASTAVKQLLCTLGVKPGAKFDPIQTLESYIERTKENDSTTKETKVEVENEDRGREGDDSSVTGEEKRTDLGPLHYAAYSNNVKTMEALVRQGAKINARGGFNETPLHSATAGNDNDKTFEALKFLVLQDDVDLDAVDSDHDTALMTCIVRNSLQSALLLVKSGANVDIYSEQGDTALHLACSCCNMQSLVAELLAKTHNVNCQDVNKRTPLHIAINAKNWDYVMPLIEAGADLNAQDKNGRTPLHQACFGAPAELLIKMIERGPDLTIKGYDDETVLHILCQYKLSEVVQVMLTKSNVDINARTKKGMTPLILAARKKNIENVKLLVQGGADMAVLDSDLQTALSTAICNQNDEIATFLIESGSPVNPQGRSSARYKAELEHDRRAREVDTFLTRVRHQLPQVRSSKPISNARYHQKERIKPNETLTQSSGGLQSKLQMMVNQAVAHVLHQGGQNSLTQFLPTGPGYNFTSTESPAFVSGDLTANNPFEASSLTTLNFLDPLGDADWLGNMDSGHIM